MYCNNCGTHIADTSRFCSSCGAKTVPPSYSTGPALTLHQQRQLGQQPSTIQDKGFLISGIALFGLELFWAIFPRVIPHWYDYKFINFGANVLFSGFPLLFYFFTKDKDYKIVLLVLAIVLIVWSVYNNLSIFYESNPGIDFSF